jgi:hypothetical protein
MLMVETCPAEGNLSAESIPEGFGEKTNRNNFLRREILATTVGNTRQMQTELGAVATRCEHSTMPAIFLWAVSSIAS